MYVIHYNFDSVDENGAKLHTFQSYLTAYTKSVPIKRTQGLTHHGVRIVVKLRVGLYFRLTGVLLSDQGASLDRN